MTITAPANMLARALALAVFLLELACAADVTEFTYRVVNVYPHDPNAFTQGLFFRDGDLFESTGLNGSSSIRRVSLTTGEVLRKYELEDKYFGEGIVDWEDKIFGVTWRAEQGFVIGISDFQNLGTIHYEGEGWGLTRNESRLIMSNGTDELQFLNPKTFVPEASVSVTLRGRRVRYLNELEWVDGAVLSNVWQTDWVLRIDPNSGVVTGMIDLSGLLPSKDRIAGHTDVLNGIAYDAEAKRLFVTGKNWPSVFEILLVKK